MTCFQRAKKNHLKTMIFFLSCGTIPVGLIDPESAPARMSSISFSFVSCFSSRSMAVVLRLNMWKSSSSAPASRPVPKTVVGSVTERRMRYVREEWRSEQHDRTLFSDATILRQVGLVSAKFTATAVWIYTLRLVLRASGC